MALHNLVFVIDVDSEALGEDSARVDCVRYSRVKRGILHVLLHFGYKYGFEKIRWGYKFFHSRSRRNGKFISRGSDFKELRDKTFEDFGVEFDSKLYSNEKANSLQPKHALVPAAAVQNGLKEALLDFQWDRPDITSPTKLSLQPRKSGRGGTAVSLLADDISGAGRNVLFLVSRCPTSKKELEKYTILSGNYSHTDLSECIMPRGLQEMLVQRRIVLHWVDSARYLQVIKFEDHFGLERLSDVLVQVGGRVFPMDALFSLCCPEMPPSVHSDFPPYALGTQGFPLDSSIAFLLSSELQYRLAFPILGGVLHWGKDDALQSCSLSLEPVSRRQRLLPEPVEVCLKGVLRSWDAHCLSEASPESWILQCPSSSDQGQVAFRQLLIELSRRALHMFAEVNHGGLVCLAVLTPTSAFTALLTVLQPGITQNNQLLTAHLIGPAATDTSPDLPDVVSSVVEVVYDIMENEQHSGDARAKEPQVPEWAQQELNHWSSLQVIGLVEGWFPHSDQSGVSANLMESMRLLHAVAEEKEEEVIGEELSDLQQELVDSLAELYQTSQGHTDKKGTKRGAQRTPVRQKMKTMSRSLQMLNVARLNVKAKESLSEADPLAGEARGPEKVGKRRSADTRKAGVANFLHFKSEAELVSHLNTSYDKTVAERHTAIRAEAQRLFLAVKTFLIPSTDLGVQTSLLVQKNLLKSSKSIRQFYGTTPDTESKVRECQFQAVLRLELCRLLTSEQSDSPDMEQMSEEVADMLRIISLTKDPTYLAKFLQDELLPGFLTAIPRVLADIYHSLGTQLPEALAAVLPSDFFSDESVAKDSVSPSSSSPLSSISLSLAPDSGERLQDLRNRSANKRKSGMLTCRSMTESSQSLRQIEMPRKTTRTAKLSVPVEKTVEELPPPPPQKQATQEVTKVRRNLFNQRTASPSKKAKMPRSQSVSAVEGLKGKRTQETEEHHKLLTKKVTETPAHKQVSSRLLYRQKMGRRSVPTEECIVEESPVKAEDLRRSPRLKNFVRRHSNTFYSTSQPRSRNLDKAVSSSQLPLSDSNVGAVNLQTVQSPMRLLFGATQSPCCLKTSFESYATRASRRRLSTDSDVFDKTPTKSPGEHSRAADCNRTPKTPQTSRTPQGRRTPKSPFLSHVRAFSATQSPVAGTSHQSVTAPQSNLFRSPVRRSLTLNTPQKASPMQSPLKSILKTPVKTLIECISLAGVYLLQSPCSRTPKKSVTWSPSPCKPKLQENTPFKVPQSPTFSMRTSPVLLKTPIKFDSTLERTNSKTKAMKATPVTAVLGVNKTSPVVLLSRIPDPFALACTVEPVDSCTERSYRDPQKIATPIQDVPGATKHQECTTPDHSSPTTPNALSPNQIPGLAHCMLTRSGRTPSKDSETPFPSSGKLTPLKSTTILTTPPKRSLKNTQLHEHDISPTTPSKKPRARTSSGSVAKCRTRQNLRSQSSESLPVPEGCDPRSEQTCSREDDGQLGSQERTSESSHASGVGSGSQTDSQHFDSSQFSSAATEDESMDIADAAVTKTQLTGGIKMNISFSRKSSLSNEVFQFTGSPKPPLPPEITRGRSYGFRLTPDRQQREAAARMGYSNNPPRFSTPRASGTPKCRKGLVTLNPLTYQVELEMQASGLPKLKFKRADSFDACDALGCGVQVPSVGLRLSQMDSPLSVCPKHRDPGCVSPSLCTHGTPAKSTPGKGGSVQTYICQTYTPTRQPVVHNMSPVGVAELIPLSPSPQSVGRATPENLNSWPRKKKARAQVVGGGGKAHGLKREPLIEEMLEEAELQGVYRLQETDDADAPLDVNTWVKPKQTNPTLQADAAPLDQLGDMDWMECLVHEAEEAELSKGENMSWSTENGDTKSVVTPPSSKVRKPVTASGILALTESPLLFKGKSSSANKRAQDLKDEVQSEHRMEFEVEHSPFSQPTRHSSTARTYSRKKLLD